MTARANVGLPLSDRIRRRLRRDVLEPLRRHTVMPYRSWRNAGRTYRPVFVTGAMGSGTTLVALSLAQRLDCAAVIPESAHAVREDSFLHVPPLGSFASVAAFQASLAPAPDWTVEEGRDALLQLFRTHANRSGNVVIDKGPNAHLARSAFLRSCFPDARFVLVFRDPVVTIEGFRRKWPLFGNDTLDASIRFYADLHEQFLKDTGLRTDEVVLVCYETLVSHYDAMLDALGSRLGLRPATRRRGLETRANVEGQGIRNVRRNRIEVDPDANRKSYARLSEAEIARIQAELGPLHRHLAAHALTVPPPAGGGGAT